MPYYLNLNINGLISCNSVGDGYEIELIWATAYPSKIGNKIAYNIYSNSDIAPVFPETFFYQSPSFVSVDGSTNVIIKDLPIGDMLHFAVRAIEYDKNFFDLTTLPIAYNGLRSYPKSLLRSNIGTTDTIIPLIDVEQFPSTGTIKLGAEQINYSSVDVLNNNLVLTDAYTQRGFNGSIITIHNTDGYDGYSFWDPSAIFWPVINEDQNTRVFETWNRFDVDHFPFNPVDGYHQRLVDDLNTDLSGDDAANVNFPPYDFAGYHRTDPVLLLNGTCVGSYLSGYMFCADSTTGVGQQIRGISVQDRNLQRQEVLLSTTGEPVVLVKKRWTGITCKCMLPYNEYPEARCNTCFIPGTLVRTELGLRPIETIRIGERVLSSDGLYHPVTRVFKNPYHGVMKSITTSTTSNPIYATPEHPFMTLRGHNPQRGCGPKCNQQLKHGWLQDKHNLIWDKASQLKEKDWLVAKWSKNVIDMNKIQIPQEFRKNTKLGSIRNGAIEFDVDDEFLWVVGLYLAEGWSGTRSIGFALHKNEIVFQNRVVEFFKRYGFNSKISPKGENGVSICINSTTLSKWFPAWLGKGCANKRIPEVLMNLPPEKGMSIVRGIDDGDGTKRENEQEITQTSEILALQVVELLHRCGKQPLLRTYQSNFLTPKGNKRKLAYIVNWELEGYTKNRRGRWSLNGELLTKIKEADDVYYCGDVYNLEVGGDHTYIVQNILVHNCMGGGIVISWEQYFNPRRSDGRIMVRFDPSVDTVKATDSGLESDMTPNCWTLAVPTIRQRDLIMRFEDDQQTPEFFYEVISVTRNKLFLDQMGAQKFAAQRIRKTDIVYNIPITYDTSTIPRVIQTSISSSNGLPPHSHSLVIDERITSVSQINQITGISFGHSHYCRNGVISDGSNLPHGAPGIGHTHTIVLP